MSEIELNEKQKRFCDQYVIDLDRVRAYQFVYQVDDYNVASASASRLLANVNIQNYVKKLQDEIQERTKVKADDVINELAKIAFSNVGRIFTVDNRILNVDQMEDNDTAAIQSIEIDETVLKDDEGEKMTIGTNKKVKMYDKIRALEALGKHFGIFEKDNSQKKDATVTIFQLPDNGRK